MPIGYCNTILSIRITARIVASKTTGQSTSSVASLSLAVIKRGIYIAININADACCYYIVYAY